MLYVFSGLDGAGKSTQIDLLKIYFKNENKKTKVFWSRGGYTPGFQLIKNTIRFFSGKKLPKPGLTIQREKALLNPFIRKIWLLIAILDLIFYYGFYLRFMNLMNYYIICDRYILDTCIDFKLVFSKEKINRWFLWRLLEVIALKPNYIFIMTIPVQESLDRSKLKLEPFPDKAEILEKRLFYYNLYINEGYGIHINGLNNKVDIHNRIINEIEK